MKKLFLVCGAAIVVIAIVTTVFYFRSSDRYESLHYEREETELIISNTPRAQLTLFKAGKDLQDASAMSSIEGDRTWLSKGNYFLKVDHGPRSLFYPVPIHGYRSGPDESGTFIVTIRPPGPDSPHGMLPDLPDYVLSPVVIFFLVTGKTRRNHITFGSVTFS